MDAWMPEGAAGALRGHLGRTEPPERRPKATQGHLRPPKALDPINWKQRPAEQSRQTSRCQLVTPAFGKAGLAGGMDAWMPEGAAGALRGPQRLGSLVATWGALSLLNGGLRPPKAT